MGVRGGGSWELPDQFQPNLMEISKSKRTPKRGRNLQIGVTPAPVPAKSHGNLQLNPNLPNGAEIPKPQRPHKVLQVAGGKGEP